MANNISELRRDVDQALMLVVSASVQGTAAATAGNYGIFFTAPYPCRVVGVIERHGTASSAGTLDIVKVPSGTAIGSGTSVLTTPMSTAGTANTNVIGTVASNNTSTVLNTGDSLGAVAGGTLTGLASSSWTVFLRPLVIEK